MRIIGCSLVFGLIFGSNLSADILVSAIGDPPKETPGAEYKWHNSSYVGYSWSLKPGLKNPDPTKYNQVASGDTDNISLGGTSYAGICLSRSLLDWLAVGFSYEIFNNFNYQGYHVGGTQPGQSGTVDFLRSFSLEHQAALLNFYFIFPKRLAKSVGQFEIKPILGAGVGTGISKMTNFDTITYAGSPRIAEFTTIGLMNLKVGLAGFVDVGCGFRPNGTTATFGFGYRYYTGGRFSSGQRFTITDSGATGDLIASPPWTGILRTNQLKLFINFDF